MICGLGRLLLVWRGGDNATRHDLLLRRSQFIHLGEGVVEVSEGIDGHFLVIRKVDANFEATVRSVHKPEVVLASGTFDTSWAFSGDAQLWSRVPEYLFIVAADERRHLLRIADGFIPDPLEGLGFIERVIAVPDSRLVVLAGEGYLTVWDPIAHRAGAHLRLSNGTSKPVMRFNADASQLWLNDGPNMLKLETRKWELVDAAGSEDETQPVTDWRFVDDGSKFVVLRHEDRHALVLDSETMLPGGSASFDGVPTELAGVNTTKLIALNADAALLRARVRPLES